MGPVLTPVSLPPSSAFCGHRWWRLGCGLPPHATATPRSCSPCAAVTCHCEPRCCFGSFLLCIYSPLIRGQSCGNTAWSKVAKVLRLRAAAVPLVVVSFPRFYGLLCHECSVVFGSLLFLLQLS